MKLQKSILTALALAGTFSISAQDLRFSQPFANPLKVNPSIMSFNQDIKFVLHYRSQWATIEKGYSTYSFSAFAPIRFKEKDFTGDKEKLDIGFNVLNDKAGAFSTLNFSLAVGYNLPVSKNGWLNFALMYGYVQKSLNTSNLSFDEQYVLGSYSASNPNNEAILNTKVGYSDVGFSSMWYFTPTKAEGGKLNVYMGVSAFHLNTPNESFTGSSGDLPVRISFQGGIKILGEKKIDITPNIIINSQRGNENIAAGLLLDYNFDGNTQLILGIYFRKRDAMAFSIGVSYQTFSFAYSYDVVTSQISSSIAKLNAHELTLAYRFSKGRKKSKSSPSFF